MKHVSPEVICNRYFCRVACRVEALIMPRVILVYMYTYRTIRSSTRALMISSRRVVWIVPPCSMSMITPSPRSAAQTSHCPLRRRPVITAVSKPDRSFITPGRSRTHQNDTAPDPTKLPPALPQWVEDDGERAAKCPNHANDDPGFQSTLAEHSLGKEERQGN